MTIFYQSQDSRCSKKIKEDASHTFHMIQVCHMCHFSAPLDLHFFILSKSCQGSAAAAVGKFSWEVPVSLEAWHPCFPIIQGMVWHLHDPRWSQSKKKHPKGSCFMVVRNHLQYYYYYYILFCFSILGGPSLGRHTHIQMILFRSRMTIPKAIEIKHGSTLPSCTS